MIPSDFDIEYFATNMAEQASEKVPLYLPENVKDEITIIIYNYIKISCNALNQENIKYDTEVVVLIAQLVAEWMYHKKIDNYVNEIPKEYDEPVCQQVAFAIFETAKQCVQRNDSQDTIINYVESVVNQKYFDLMAGLAKENKLKKPITEIMKQSNLQDYVNEQEKLSKIKYNFAQENQTEQLNNVFNVRLPDEINTQVKKTILQNPDNKCDDLVSTSKFQTCLLIGCCSLICKYGLQAMRYASGITPLYGAIIFILILCILYLVLIKFKKPFYGISEEYKKTLFMYICGGLTLIILNLYVFPNSPIGLCIIISFLLYILVKRGTLFVFNKLLKINKIWAVIGCSLLFIIPICLLCFWLYLCFLYNDQSSAVFILFLFFIMSLWLLFYGLSKLPEFTKCLICKIKSFCFGISEEKKKQLFMYFCIGITLTALNLYILPKFPLVLILIVCILLCFVWYQILSKILNKIYDCNKFAYYAVSILCALFGLGLFVLQIASYITHR